jgi:hypothetical protein
LRRRARQPPEDKSSIEVSEDPSGQYGRRLIDPSLPPSLQRQLPGTLDATEPGDRQPAGRKVVSKERLS